MPSSTIGDEDDPCLMDDRERIVPDIRGVEPEESSNIYTYHREDNNSCHEDPREPAMIVDVPLSVDELHRRIPGYHPCERHRRNIDDVIVDCRWESREVDEVSQYIEAIRQEE